MSGAAVRSARRSCVATVSVALAALAFVDAAAAASQMYKCVEGGRTVYQQQACAVSHAAEPAASAPRAAVAVAEAASPAARKVRRPSPAASSAP